MFPYTTRKRKRNKEELQRNAVSTSTTADLHTYFLRGSALKFTFLLKNNNHASTSTNGTRCWMFVCVRNAPPRGSGSGQRGLFFLCKNRGGAQLCGHTLRTCSPYIVPPPVLPAPITKSSEENLILRNPPPCPTPPLRTKATKCKRRWKD